MRLALSLFMLVGSLAHAQERHGFECKVENPFGKSTIQAEVSPTFSVELIDANERQIVLASMSQMCGRPMDFQKHCTLVDNSQTNFVSFSANCYESNDLNARWLAKFDLSFYESNGMGISHCSGAAVPTTSYKLSKCTKN